MNTEQLFADFPEISREEWIEKIKKDLKGRPYEKLAVHSDEGVDIPPVYTQEDIENISWLNDPTVFERNGAMVKLGLPDHHNGDYQPDFIEMVLSQSTLNENNPDGAALVGFESLGQTESSRFSYSRVPENKEVRFLPGSSILTFYNSLAAACAGKDLRGNLGLNPYLFSDPEKGLKEMVAVAERADKDFPGLKWCNISLLPVRMKGGNLVHELAMALDQAVNIIDTLTNAGFSAEKVLEKIAFDFPVGSAFFEEMAKFRAFRMLWLNVCKQYGVSNAETELGARTSVWRQSVLDKHTNLLRGTTAAMAAVAGGCDSLVVTPFNQVSEPFSDEGIRLSRNIHLILRHESFFEQVIDPGAGSYYLESLTREYVLKAWQMFIDLQKNNNADQLLRDSLAQKEKKIEKAAEKMIGVNIFPNQMELLTSNDIPSRQSLRASGKFELLVRRTLEHIENGNAAPSALLLTFGPVAMRKARANFSLNFLGCGGIRSKEVLYNDLDGLRTLVSNEKPVQVVLCSADPNYFDEGPMIIETLNKEFPDLVITIAGRPDNWESLKESGLSDNIYSGMNMYEYLSGLLDKVLSGKEVSHEA